MVLIGCDRCKAGFLKNKGFVILLGIFLAVLAGVHINHMKPGLIAVHGVQNDLQKTNKKTTDDLSALIES